jgi:hypothetical protein
MLPRRADKNLTIVPSIKKPDILPLTSKSGEKRNPNLLTSERIKMPKKMGELSYF